jgi:SNF2 family DNA or RNA helicase
VSPSSENLQFFSSSYALFSNLRILQHPYLIDPDLEQRGLSPVETQKQLVDASAKLHLLKSLLPKLKRRGHRVLLFSQVRQLNGFFTVPLFYISEVQNGLGYC